MSLLCNHGLGLAGPMNNTEMSRLFLCVSFLFNLMMCNVFCFFIYWMAAGFQGAVNRSQWSIFRPGNFAVLWSMDVLFVTLVGVPITTVLEWKGHSLGEMTDLHWHHSSTGLCVAWAG